MSVVLNSGLSVKTKPQKYVPSQCNIKKNVLQKGPETEKNVWIEPTAELVNQCFFYVVLTPQLMTAVPCLPFIPLPSPRCQGHTKADIH